MYLDDVMAYLKFPKHRIKVFVSHLLSCMESNFVLGNIIPESREKNEVK